MVKRSIFPVIFISLGLVLMSLNSLLAQSFVVKETDTTEFPLLNAIIEMQTPEQPLESDFRVLDEDKDTLNFTLAKSYAEESEAEGRMILFLVDASSYTDGIPIKSFKDAVLEALDMVQEDDRVNVAYFGHPEENGKALIPIEPEFRLQSNLERLKSQTRNKIEAALRDSTESFTAYKAMKEGVELLLESRYDGQKALIVISGAIDDPGSIWKPEDVIRTAERGNVLVPTINFDINRDYTPDIYEKISMRTDAGDLSRNVSSQNDIVNAIADILESRRQVASNRAQVYELSFQTKEPADGNPHQYTIIYKSETPYVANYQAPEEGGVAPGEGFLSRYGIYLLVIAGGLMAVLLWYYREQQIRQQEELEEEEELRLKREEEERRREDEQKSQVQELKDQNMRLQEQLRLKEQEIAKQAEEVPTVVPPQKYDLKNTSISGGGSAPTFQVAAGAYHKNYRLNKPTMTIGRSANNDIVIPEQTVSGKHATITIENGSFFINDLDSTNGTFVNGTRIDSKILKSGDMIKLGAASCRFQL